MTETFTQEAPFPHDLADLVQRCRYRPRWMVRLVDDYDRGQGSRGLTLVITTLAYDTYNPDQQMRVNHLFPVPPAAFDRRSWQWWLFQQFLLVEQHECMEFFQIRTDHYDVEDACAVCGHQATAHDGRDSSCQECADSHRANFAGAQHRFTPAEPRYERPYAPMHGPGNDPYLITVERSEIDRRTNFRGEVES